MCRRSTYQTRTANADEIGCNTIVHADVTDTGTHVLFHRHLPEEVASAAWRLVAQVSTEDNVLHDMEEHQEAVVKGGESLACDAEGFGVPARTSMCEGGRARRAGAGGGGSRR